MVRKNLFLSLLAPVLLLSSASALSLTPRSGAYTCGRLGESKYKCLKIIKDRFVDEWASGACDRYTDVSYTLKGMEIIVDGKFQSNAVIACDRFDQSYATNSCLEVIKNCSFADEEVRECDALTTFQGTLECFQFYCR